MGLRFGRDDVDRQTHTCRLAFSNVSVDVPYDMLQVMAIGR